MSLLFLIPPALALTLDREPVDPLTTDARCNDGSVPIYYISLAPPESEHPDSWLISFHSHGDACSSEGDCDPLLTDQHDTMGTGCTEDALGVVTCDQNVGSWSLTTDPPWGATRSRGGVFSDNAATNPAFYDWNKVQIISCSSDLWSGDGGAITFSTPGAFPDLGGANTMRFDGAKIAAAVIGALDVNYGLGDADLIVLAGTGTGASGVINHLDRLAGYFGGESPPVVKGLIDAAGPRQLLDMWDSGTINDDPSAPNSSHGCRSRLSSGTLPDLSWYEDGLLSWGAVVDESCQTAAGASTSARARCLFPDWVFATDQISTPFFYRQDLADSEGTDRMDAWMADPSHGAPAHADPDACFIQVMHSRGLNAQRASAMGGFFLTCEGQHAGLSYNAPYATHTANGEHLNDLISRFISESDLNTRAVEAGCLIYP